jgi:phosphoribosylaminoimidazolecarboxamide formyltransferase/IMP cyclohydrolase
MIRALKGFVEDRIPVRTVIVSVFDKTGLEQFIPELMQINPNIRFLSSTGTYDKIKDLLGHNYQDNLLQIAEYTRFPEMEGGLVKTLHPKIHAGILGERNNPLHQKYLSETLNGAFYIDMVIVNLYPFKKVITAPDSTFEKARGNIDIGGPTMIRAAAKNFPSCAAVCNPSYYPTILKDIAENNGATSFEQRLLLAQEVFKTTAEYDRLISLYFNEELKHNIDEIKSLYRFNQGVKND